MQKGESKPPTKEGTPSMNGREKPGGIADRVTWTYGSSSTPPQWRRRKENRVTGAELSRKDPFLLLLISKWPLHSLAFRDLKTKRQIALRPPEAVDNTPYMSAKAREIGENLLLACLAPERSQTNKLVREDFICSHAIQSVAG